jgi:hypothetical protein
MDKKGQERKVEESVKEVGMVSNMRGKEKKERDVKEGGERNLKERKTKKG